MKEGALLQKSKRAFYIFKERQAAVLYQKVGHYLD